MAPLFAGSILIVAVRSKIGGTVMTHFMAHFHVIAGGNANAAYPNVRRIGAADIVAALRQGAAPKKASRVKIV